MSVDEPCPILFCAKLDKTSHFCQDGVHVYSSGTVQQLSPYTHPATFPSDDGCLDNSVIMNRVVMPAGGGDSDTFVGVAVPSTIKRLPKLLDQVKDVKMVTVELVKIAVELIIDPMKPPSSDLDQLSAQFAVAVVRFPCSSVTRLDVS
jgi:hypothetical protein